MTQLIPFGKLAQTVPPDSRDPRETGHEMAGFVPDDEAMTTLTLDDGLIGREPQPRRRRMPAITTERLVRTFDGVSAVDGLDLDIRQGEIYGFLGPNGAGKSTTVRMLCTLLAPTSGRATVAGYDVVEAPGAIRLRIGVALQEAALDPRQTGTELLMLQGLLYGLSRSAARRRVKELGALIDLGD